MEITDQDLQLAAQGAKSAARSARGLVPLSDLVAEANLWMVNNIEKVVLWREQGTHGKNKLRNACRQRCLTVVASARRLHNRDQNGDQYYYTPGIIREILPDIFDREDWSMTSRLEKDDAPKGASRPAEGNNRLAMICDVRAAFYGLPQADRNLLYALYGAGGAHPSVVAARYEVVERTIQRREQRILEKMVERLGGEPPFFTGR